MSRNVKTLKLNSEYLSNLAKDMGKKSKDVRRLLSLVVKNTLEEGLTFLRNEIPVDTGDLLNSAKIVYSDGDLIGQIRVDSDHAIYVEYGTGIVGAGSPHPELNQSDYDKHKHGEIGWVYFDPEYGFVRTKGQIGQQFFYRTKEYMKERMGHWSKQLFKDFWSDLQ